ncbi:MAG: hypothetical protein PF503_18760 [Desulfobacula sp.]|jgi:NTP pyrophosphatase (non-canonical NTP hydrolase)|nr:hypothetical protein [Desulfobacula sp.]
MTKDELKKAFPDHKSTLEHLAEECNEVAQAKSKIFRFGLEDAWPPQTGLTNRRKLTEELGHLQAVVDVLLAHEIITQEEIDASKPHKWESMIKWNAYRGTRGEL